MKKMVKINAVGVNSKYGYIVEECDDFALIKVGCKNDRLDCLSEENCIILGKMYTSTPTDSSAYTLTDELKVTGQAYLPPTTKIGEYTAQDLTNLYNAASNGGTGSLDEEELQKHLKEYVK